MASKRKSGKVGAPWTGMSLIPILFTYYASIIALVVYRIRWTPNVVPATAPASEFSEERALHFVRVLTEDIGDRQVSSPGLDVATEYMLQEAYKLKALGQQREDVVVEVLKERVTGAVGMTFTDINFTNAYRGLDNVLLMITPKDPAAAAAKGLLIVSHYDSAVCSTGAADDAAQVGIMLEVARVILSRIDETPWAPIVFLWTGGEEPVSPAAHGWQSQSAVYPTLGAFINLEAMGGGGLPIVFQHTGAWTLEAWARGAPYGRGSRVAQDVFDLGLIPADSDYRMFSARHYGHLPGVDVAFILDSSAYHTYRDTVERIRTGVMQEMGDNLLGAIGSFTRFLAEHPLEAAAEEEVHERAVYFDVLAYYMVSYRDSLARTLHFVPVVTSLCLPLLSSVWLGPSNTGKAFFALFSAAARTALSILLAVATPALFGAARTLLLGVPMSWFASHWVGHVTLTPLAFVAAITPYLRVKEEATKWSPTNHGAYLSTQVQGVALTSGLIAWGLTAAGMTGNGTIFFLSSCLAAISSVAVATPTLSSLALLVVLVASLVPSILGSTIIAVFLEVIMERMALSGFVSVVLADVVVGVLCGAAVLAVTCGAMLPLIGYSLHGHRRRVITAILLTAFAISAYVAVIQMPSYSEYRPKRIILSHIHTTEAVATQEGAAPYMRVLDSRLSVATVDSTPIDFVLQNLGPATPSSVPGFEGPDPLQEVPSSGREFTPIFPLDIMLAGVAIKAPPSPTPLVQNLPYLRIVSEEKLDAQVRRLNVEMFNEKLSWGIVNITGPLLAWNITDKLHPSKIGHSAANGPQHVVRFTSQHADPVWHFWLDVSTDPNHPEALSQDGEQGVTGQLHLELLVSYLDRTDVIDTFVTRMPKWVTESWYATVYYSEWRF